MTMMPLLATVFAASLFGSLHCAGMCGGFVGFYAAGDDGKPRLWPHVAYNAGRLATYVSLGFIAGSLGHALDNLGALVGLGRLAMLVSGGLIVAFGVSTLARQLGVDMPRLRLADRLRLPLMRLTHRLRGQPAVVRALIVGLSSTLLPCGWLYAFVTTAAGTGKPMLGALAMATFWLGTVPAMAMLGMSLQRFLGPLRRRLPVLSAVMLVVVGLLSIAARNHLPVGDGASHETAACHGG